MTVENEGKKIEGHSYDGIEELDNSLPRWWITIFYATIVFSAGYFFYYSMGDGPTLTQEWRQAQAKLELENAKNSGGNAPVNENALLAVVKSHERQKAGKELFQARCGSCHGAQGQGGIGPNLVDDYWIHGGKPAQILAIISNGVGDKGMPAWGALLKQDELQSLVAYVKSVRGTHPPGEKAPQGDLSKE